MSKEKFIELFCTYITRSGSTELLDYLEKSDFFTAPASTRFHGDHPGGLCEHSVNVFNQLTRLCEAYPEINATTETIAIISLLHDVCKISSYKTEMRNAKQNGVWVQVPYYTFKESMPFGNHGGKSVFMIERFMRLTVPEAVAINCHMGNEDGKYTVSAAYEKYPLAWLLHVADEAATYLNETKEDKQ